MKKIFDKLNLRPFERRLVVIGGVVVFLVVQFLYVWPYFGQAGKLDIKREEALKTLQIYADEFAQTNKYARAVREMEGAGISVPPEDQANDFQMTISKQAAAVGVSVNSNSKPIARTNDFFIELRSSITTMSTEEALVSFLYNLGAGNSLIRVRDLTMRPDPTRLRLTATITLVASYQKKPTARPAAPAPKTAAPANTPQIPAAAAPAAPKPAPPKPLLPKPSIPPKK